MEEEEFHHRHFSKPKVLLHWSGLPASHLGKSLFFSIRACLLPQQRELGCHCHQVTKCFPVKRPVNNDMCSLCPVLPCHHPGEAEDSHACLSWAAC